jgi:hypothetical protein
LIKTLSDWLATAREYQSISIVQLKKLPGYAGVSEDVIQKAIDTAIERQYCYQRGDRLIKK